MGCLGQPQGNQEAWTMTKDQMVGGLRKAYVSRGDDGSRSRFIKIPGTRHKAPKLSKTGTVRTLYPDTVVDPSSGILVSSHSIYKIGRDVRIGKFYGYYIYHLSLEERATCPKTCKHWRSCYGNNMRLAKRTNHRDFKKLTHTIHYDLLELTTIKMNRKYPRLGILIRLHELGDFFSIAYVQFWSDMLAAFPNLAIYGYTARRPTSRIGLEIQKVKDLYPDRFRIRWSDGKLDTDCTISINKAENCPENAFICPEQLDVKHKDGTFLQCMSCGACWNGNKNVAFLSH